MFKNVDEKFKKYCVRDGSLLKKQRSIGGIGAGLSAAGMILTAMALLGIVMAAMSMAGGDKTAGSIAIVTGGVFALAGVPLLILGWLMSRNRPGTYLEYFVKNTGYTAEQLQEFDQEVLAADSQYFILERRLQKNSSHGCCLATRHWLKMPWSTPLRYVDIAAIFWEKDPYYKKMRQGDTLFIVTSAGETKCHFPKEPVARSVIEMVTSHNPIAVTVRKIIVQNQAYDCAEQPEAVAGFYRAAVKAQNG